MKNERLSELAKQRWESGLYDNQKTYKGTFCLDCNKQIVQGSKRCTSCAAKVRWADAQFHDSVSDAIGRATSRNWDAGVYVDREQPFGGPSNLECMFSEALSRYGVHFISQFCLPGHNRPVDFMILGACLVVEIDGDYWHSLPGMVERDASKDDVYTKAGYSILRIPEHEFHKFGADTVVRNHVLPEINYHG